MDRAQPCFKKLNDAVDKTIKRVTSKNRIKPYLKEYFKDVLQKDKHQNFEMFEAMLIELENILKDEIHMQLEANNVEKLLNELDQLKLQFKESKEKKWRPSGNPEEDIKAHLDDLYDSEITKLEKVLATYESQNKLLNECVEKTDIKLQQSFKELKAYCSSWEKAALEVSDETRTSLMKCV